MYITPNDGLIAGSAHDLKPFVLYQPDTISAAVEILKSEAPGLVFYAGGTDLCAGWREGKRVEGLVWLKGIKKLKNISVENGALHIGALVTHYDGIANDAIGTIPGLAEAWGKIATVRIRFSATIGGNLMARRTSYEMAILLSALNAKLCFVTAAGSREIEAASLFANDSFDGCLLTHICIPLKQNPKLDYERALRPITTQALGLWTDSGGQPQGRLVIATKFLPPHCIDLNLTTGSSAVEIATDALAALPEAYQDPAVGNRYLRQVAQVYLRRQLIRLGAAA